MLKRAVCRDARAKEFGRVADFRGAERRERMRACGGAVRQAASTAIRMTRAGRTGSQGNAVGGSRWPVIRVRSAGVPYSDDLETDGVFAGLFGRQRDAQRLLVLREFQFAAMAQQIHAADLAHLILAAESERRDHGFVLRPAHHEGVQRAALGGVADVGRGQVFAIALVERGVAGGRRRGASGDLPGTRAVDALAVHRHPFGDLFHRLEFVVIRLAAVGQRDVEHQVAVAADDIAEQVHHVLAGLVLLALLVVPAADAGIGLPRVGQDVAGHAALDIERAGALLAILLGLAGVEAVGHLVVVVGDQLVAPLAERNAAIGVEQVGLVLVDQVLHAEEVETLPGIGSLAAHGLRGDRLVLGERVVEIGVGGIGAVVGDAGERAGLIGAVRDGQPVVAVGEMLADGELQAVLAGRGGEEADDILLRAGGDRVPARLVFGVPQVEVVVVDAHRHEVFRAGLLVELDQVVGVEIAAVPGEGDVLEAELGGVAVVLDVVLVLRAVLHVHVARVPIAELGGGLRSPMGPHAELVVAEPLGNAVLLERFGAVVRAFGDFGDRLLRLRTGAARGVRARRRQGRKGCVW